ncbi:MAG: hypothetical protein IH831_03595 [Planctomycetes bacterium]|nr:hypothetical protein [Planctomycetota bacterium]
MRFDLRNLEDGALNFLDVVLGTSILDSIFLDADGFASDPDFASIDVLIPEALRGQANSLEFSLIQADDFVAPSVQIDNLIFVPEPGSFLLVAGGLLLLSSPGFRSGFRARFRPRRAHPLRPGCRSSPGTAWPPG